ncbi:hypothetical protein [Candidatus Electronema sp. PJ]|uniref:hypothetical protein n=1 Tax=Candidatus Electronema sp. PJ TaxID=3401572 RepID=UPI003AA7DA80
MVAKEFGRLTKESGQAVKEFCRLGKELESAKLLCGRLGKQFGQAKLLFCRVQLLSGRAKLLGKPVVLFPGFVEHVTIPHEEKMVCSPLQLDDGVLSYGIQPFLLPVAEYIMRGVCSAV